VSTLDETRVSCQGKKYGDRTPPGPCVPHGGMSAAPKCPLPSRGEALLSEQGPGIVVVVSCTKLPQPKIIATVYSEVYPSDMPPLLARLEPSHEYIRPH